MRQTPSLLSLYLELAKFRLTALVLVTTAIGYVLASGEGIRWGGFFLTVLGTALAAAGANTLNQVLEVDRDAKMQRTCRRPLPAQHISRLHASVFGLATVAAGVGVLNEFVNPLTALLGLANVVIYVAVYTPLKPRTSLNTLVGAICGALPPMMGWSGASGQLSLHALVLGAILFFWQIPHALALAWLYRDDYRRGGFRMLPVIDPSGRFTCLLILLYSLVMFPLGLTATFTGLAGYLFAAFSLALGLILFLQAVRLHVSRTDGNARRMFLLTVVYLPLLLLAMAIDSHPIASVPSGGYASGAAADATGSHGVP